MNTRFFTLLTFLSYTFLACEQEELQTPLSEATIELRTGEDDINACLNQPFGQCSYLDVDIAMLDAFDFEGTTVEPTYMVRLTNTSDLTITAWTVDDSAATATKTSSTNAFAFKFSEPAIYQICATFECGDDDGFICCEEVELN